MKIKIIAAALLLAGTATNAHSQSTAYAETKALLVEPITISKTFDMHFGTVASSALPGSVVLDYADNRTASGGVTLPNGSTTQKTAVFAVTGQPGSSISIAIPTAPITLVGSVTGSITVSNFLCEQTATTSLASDGKATLKVGATLNVPGNTAGGTYTNNLQNANALFVTVNYN